MASIPSCSPKMVDATTATKHMLKSQRKQEKGLIRIRTRLSELCKRGRPDVAERVWESLPRPTTAVLWNTIIIGYICNGMPREALLFYATLALTETRAHDDAYTYSSLLKACAQTQQLKLGKSIHCRIIRSKLLSRRAGGIVAHNSLLSMYSTTTCESSGGGDGDGDQGIVKKVFDRMSKRNVVSWNTLIAWYVKTRRFSKALAHFKLMVQMGIKPTVVSFVNVFPSSPSLDFSLLLYGLLLKSGNSSNVFSVSSAINMFSQLSDLEAATKVFHHLSPYSHNSIQVWNTLIHAHLHNHSFLEALHLFLQILEQQTTTIAPDSLTFVASLTAVSHLQLLRLGHQLHAYLIKASFSDITISNALISMYSRCNSIEEAFQVFDRMLDRDLVSWNTMVSAFVQNGFDDEGLMLAYEMKKQGMLFDSITLTALLSAASNLRNSALGKQAHAYIFRHGIRFQGMDSYLIDMYSKSGFIHVAQLLFEVGHTRDHVTWNAMIAGYAQNGEMEKAFTLLRQMLKQQETPSSVTLASVLPACIPLGAISLGKQIHAFAIRNSLDNNVFVATALVDMYSKCASISYAENVCTCIADKNPVTYTTMILGYGQHGLGKRALSLFKAMCKSGIKPDSITFVALLSACSYSGLVDEGIHIFESMDSLYGILPTSEHYSCVVDMLGRAGRLLEAYEFVKQLGDKGNVGGIWGSLLAACRIHGELELGKMVARRLFQLEKDTNMAGYHVLLSNIYADKEMWDSASKVRKDMRDRGLRKVTGYSWIEIGGTVNCFKSRDQSHSQCDAIYSKLEELADDMKAAGYKPSVGYELSPREGDE